MQPGTIVAGRYRIEAELGRGGMGSVFRATHVELGREVALKMVLPDVLALDEGLARFRREAQLAQTLEHPHIVRLYDFGQTEHGLPFITFELLRGVSLDHAISPRGMPPARVTRIVSQILEALMEAHTRGIVHRDIKPGNVFLCEFSGESDYVKVLDFGIAKATNAHTVLTQAGFNPGTPSYMAPELVRGEPATPAAELYAVGLLMAEMLTGTVVFAGAPTEVVSQQLSPQPVPLPPMLSTSPLWPVLARATQKDATRRYGSAAEMLQDLETAERAAAIPSTPYASYQPAPTAVHPMVPPYAAPPRRRSSTAPLVIGLALAGVLGVVGLGVLLLGSRGDDGPMVQEDDDAPKKKAKKKAPKVDEPEEEPAATPIKARLEKLGWKVISESTSKQPTLKVSTYTGQKGSQTASLYVYEAQDEAVSKSLETSLKAKGSALKRVGSRVYWLLTIPADESLAESLLDDLVP